MIDHCISTLNDFTERIKGFSKHTMGFRLMHSNGRIPRSGLNLDINMQLHSSANHEKQSPSENEDG